MALICDQVRINAEHYPDQLGYTVYDVGAMTNAEWERGANRVAHALIDRGVAEQDRVILAFQPHDALPNLQAYMGVHKAGAVNVPLNVRLSPGEMRHVLQHAEPTAVLASHELLEPLRQVLPDVPSVKLVATVGGGSDVSESWDAFLADDESDVQADITDQDMADILYTSGTTGLPKGVVVRHYNGSQMPPGKPEQFEGKLYLHASPFFTFAGLSFIFMPARLGMTGAYLPKFDAGRWLEIVEQEPVTMAFLVPAMIELILHHPDRDERDLSGLALLSTGSAPIPPENIQAMHELLPNATVTDAYSMSEAGAAYCVMPPGEHLRRPGAVGKPAPPVEIRIVDEEDNELPADEVGEIILRNPGKEREYFRNPEATAETWKNGWLYTGDLGKLDADGYLYIVGRKKEVIIRGGHNIHAADVEWAIHEHPDVFDVAVIGVPHDVLGEDVAAFVVPAPGGELTVEDIETWCAEHLADYKRPRTIRLVDELPRNAMGKVLKRELAHQLTT